MFEEVTRARSALQQAGTPAAAGEANELLTAALGRLFAVAEAYPELSASENFLRLQDELTDTEDKISAARRYYNTTVMHYNTGIQSLPWVLVAQPLGFREREFFAAEGDVSVPQVVVHALDVTLQQQIRRNRLKSGDRHLRLRAAALVLAGLIGAVLDVSAGRASRSWSGRVRDLRDRLLAQHGRPDDARAAESDLSSCDRCDVSSRTSRSPRVCR